MTSTTPNALDWLPAELMGVAARLGRADDLQYQLGRMALDWSRKNGGPLDVEEVERPDGKIAVEVVAIRPIPPRAAMLFSETIHHLRAAIDNTVFYLVTAARGADLPADQARKVATPIYQSATQLANWVQRTAQGRDAIPEFDSTPDLYQRIESLQPYASSATVASLSDRLALYQGVQPEKVHPLLLLQGYSNEDKHRAIRMASVGSVIQRSDEPFGSGI